MTIPLPTPGESLAGLQLANFRVDVLIKRGGMSEVYYGWDIMLRRPVAIKIIDTRLQANAKLAERFLREARSVANWRHENITQVYYADKQNGLYYFVMEYIDGMDLGDLILQYQAENSLLPIEETLRIGHSVAKALDYAHANAVIHRDVKPNNILLSLDERVLLTDFGLAMMVNEGSLGEILGTPHYMAPEQSLSSSEAVPQTDQYSLGVVMFELLTGRLPFVGDSVTSLALQHISEPPPSPMDINPNLGEAISAVLLRALHKNPERRYTSATAFMRELEQVAQVEVPSNLARLPLPPPPAASQLASQQRPSLVISRTSVVDKIAAYVAEQRPAPRPSSPNLASQIQARKNKAASLTNKVLTAVLLLLMLSTVFFIFWPKNEKNLADSPAVAANVGPSSPTPTEQPAMATATTTTTTTTRLPAPLVEESESAPTITVLPTQTAVPTATAVSTQSAPTPTETFSVPLGEQTLQFYYNNASFYILNPNEQNIAISSIGFEAYNQETQQKGPTFQGREWARFFAWVTPNACVRIELDEQESWLRPAACSRYNASIILRPLEGEKMFWLTNNAYTHFIIYWNGQPFAECPLFTGVCETRLPLESN